MSDQSGTLEEKLAAVRNEILISLPHEVPVLSLFAETRIADVVERNEILGLARVRFKDLSVAAVHIVDQAEEPKRKLKQYKPEPTWQKPSDQLDQVLSGLRFLLADRYSTWQPTMGKNRFVGQIDGKEIFGEGRISHGGGEEPTPLEAQDWDPRGTGPGAGSRVGLLDTAIATLPWFSGGWVSAYTDRLLPGQVISTRAGHATFIAGLILSQAPGATIDVRQVLDASTATADSWETAVKIVEIGQTGIDVLNLSFVCYTEDGQPPMALAAAIDRLEPSTVVVAAAGNHGLHPDENVRNRPAWPAALDDVIAVGAAKAPHELADFTPKLAPWIDVVAPGVNIHSTFLEGRIPIGSVTGELGDFHGFATWEGSSFAAAVVAGVIASGIQPGRVSARDSWRNIRNSLPEPKLTSGQFTPPYLAAETPRLKKGTGPSIEKGK